MPIINGTYVPDTLSDARSAQQQVFGDYSRRDMSDYSAAAYNYMMKQQEQAYNLQLWNLQNEYNSPAAQMKRYQDAGLNPNLIYSQQNTAQAPSAASASSFRSAGVASRGAQAAIQAIGQVLNTVKTARETYDYMAIGRERNIWEKNFLMNRNQYQAYENWWNAHLLGLDNPAAETIPGSLRDKMFRYQMDTQQQKYEQLKAIINTLDDDELRKQGLHALDQERLKIMRSQYGFINNFSSGNAQFDAFFKMLAFFVLKGGN